MKKNSFVQSFVSKANGRYNKDSADMSHGDWMCANTSLNKRPFSFDRYPFQKQIADDMHPNMDVIKPSQVGLALALDTPVATVSGCTTMGEIEVGAQVFDESGTPCNVTYTSPIFEDHDCYKLTFCTGETIIADANHRWYFEAHKAFNEDGLYGKTGRISGNHAMKGILKTSVLAEIFHENGRNLFAIPNTKAINCKNKDLIVDPYLLGLWLGDGNCSSSTFTMDRPDSGSFKTQIEMMGLECHIVDERENTLQFHVAVPRDKDLCPRGHSKAKEGLSSSGACGKCEKQNRGKESREESIPYDTMYSRFVKIGVINNKHIPQEYLRASVSQRFSLLQGLLDTDGSITKRGRCSFHNCNPTLIAQVEELIWSLGFKAKTRWRSPSRGVLKTGVVIQGKQDIAEISFVAYSDTPVFRIPRKLERQVLVGTGRPTETFRRRVVNVEKVTSVPTRCISVDSPSHLFLCGRGMIPTHNTEIQIRKAITLLIRTPNTSLIYTMPNERMFKRISKARIQPLLKYDKAFRQDAQDKTQQSMDLMRIGTSYLYVTGSSEADATSINADFVFNDEIDLTPPDMLSLFNSRLQGSDHRVSQRFSTPTYEGFGVDKGYARSDQHEYILKCAACNHHQVPLFNRDFVRVDGMPDDCDSFIHLSSKLVDSGQVKLETAKVYCEKCHKPLNLADHDNREWVAKYPSRTLNRGYRVRTFSTHRLDPVYCFTQMFKYLEKDNLKGFHNTVLGEPYTNEDQKMSDSDVDAMFGYAGCPPIDNTLPHFIGIDVGKTCHIVVARMEGTEKIRVVEFMTCPSSAIQSFVDSMRAKYNIISGLMDRYPYTPTANAIREASDGKIAPAHYTVNKPIALVTNGLDKLDYVQINRTHVLDSVFFGIKKRNLFLDGFGKFKTMIIEHLVDMVREENDEKIPVWVKLNGNDHFFHALGYMFGSIEYYRYVEGKEPFVNLTVGLSGIRHSNMLMSGESEDFFGAQDLIGFGNSYSPDKIITRY